MKGLLLAGLIAVSHPFVPASHVQTCENAQPYTLSQQNEGLNELEQKILNDLSSLEDLFNAPEMDPNDLQNRMNQILNDMNRINQTIFDQTSFNHPGVHHLPRVKSGHARTTSSGIEVAAGDPGVPLSTVNMAADIIKNLSIPVIQDSLDSVPARNTHIVLFSSPQSYANSLRKSGISSDEVDNIVSETGGLTIGSDVWIPLYNLQDSSDLANVLTHELTHVVLNQKGIGEQIPTWINEGIAWHNGLTAQSQMNPGKVQEERYALTQQVKQAAEKGQLLPLSADENDILHANYNVEWEDALAVEHLIQNFGKQTFKSFINGIAHSGVEQSFLAHFHMKQSDYEKSFLHTLNGHV
ncbi:hypothetical protein DNHGIG_22220 [Collibacillus ludicampi]|uniref:Peptidase MA-like domain-containing protein n=1 Tax=Collibacillus ludicampi TaxID=2771369 RepID=A0AAV4LFX2_9BACL|nr:hypothetical protein [Collibacillus ludicampi]GIM46673.1 hypothetical protein DNHGIG_22220 [Collibacillus ludicampi]